MDYTERSSLIDSHYTPKKMGNLRSPKTILV